MLETLVDNDVLIKGSCYRILLAMNDLLANKGSLGILGQARYVVARQLDKNKKIYDRAGAIEHWLAFLNLADEVEPTAAEIELATEIEELASCRALLFDAGESMLAAILIVRGAERLLTGDKRAIVAADQMFDLVPQFAALEGRLLCFEQLLRSLRTPLGPTVLRAQVCAEPLIDLAARICFECSSPPKEQFEPVGLDSYIAELSGLAPRVVGELP